jgi:hypothetical protein
MVIGKSPAKASLKERSLPLTTPSAIGVVPKSSLCMAPVSLPAASMTNSNTNAKGPFGVSTLAFQRPAAVWANAGRASHATEHDRANTHVGLQVANDSEGLYKGTEYQKASGQTWSDLDV